MFLRHFKEVNMETVAVNIICLIKYTRESNKFEIAEVPDLRKEFKSIYSPPSMYRAYLLKR